MVKKSKKALKSKKGQGSQNSVHVKGSEDLVQLGDFLKKNKSKIFIIVVMMKGCPHCVTLERDIVVPLLNHPSRKNGMALIEHDQLENTPLKHLASTIRGYPTVLKVEGDNTEEVENPRDLTAMKTLAGITDDDTSDEYTSDDNMNSDNPAESLELDETAENMRENNLMTPEKIKSIIKSSKKRGIVPRMDQDLNSQNSESLNTEDYKTPTSGKGTVGGSLYASLVEAGKHLAPAVLLSTAAVASRFAISRRKSKSSKRRTRSKKN
jgi:hypothetical protein